MGILIKYLSIICKQKVGHLNILLPHFPLTLKPNKKPPSLALSKRQLNTSVANANKYRKRGSPCLKPLEPWKNLEGVLLTSIENLPVDMHHLIHQIHFWPNCIISEIAIKKAQLTWSHSFSVLLLEDLNMVMHHLSNDLTVYNVTVVWSLLLFTLVPLMGFPWLLCHVHTFPITDLIVKTF